MNTESLIIAAKVLALTVCLLGFHPSGAVSETVYYYQDQTGTYHFTDLPTSDKYRPFAEFQDPEARDVSRLEQSIELYSRQYQVDPELIRAMIQVESGFETRAVSPVGAQGLMQIMPGTQHDLGLEEPFDPDANVKAGVQYFRYLLDRFQSLELALAAYNAGPSKVDAYDGIPPYTETREYVQKVKDIYTRTQE